MDILFIAVVTSLLFNAGGSLITGSCIIDSSVILNAVHVANNAFYVTLIDFNCTSFILCNHKLSVNCCLSIVPQLHQHEFVIFYIL